MPRPPWGIPRNLDKQSAPSGVLRAEVDAGEVGLRVVEYLNSSGCALPRVGSSVYFDSFYYSKLSIVIFEEMAPLSAERTGSMGSFYMHFHNLDTCVLGLKILYSVLNAVDCIARERRSFVVDALCLFVKEISLRMDGILFGYAQGNGYPCDDPKPRVDDNEIGCEPSGPTID